MSLDPDDIANAVGDEWVDKLSRRISNVIIGDFETRVSSLENQILSIRRYVAITTFLVYYQRLSDYLVQYRQFVQQEQSTTSQEKVIATSSIDRWSSHIQERYRLILDEIRRHHNPEEHFRTVYGLWKEFFNQQHVPHVESLYFET